MVCMRVKSLTKILKNRRRSWIGHTIRHNKLVLNILEGVIYGKKCRRKTSTTILKEFARNTGADSNKAMKRIACNSGVPRGGVGVFNPPPEIPKALQNRAKLNPIVKTVKNC